MAIEVLFFIVVLKVLASKIFFGKIIENAAIASDSNFWEFSQYLLNAFFQTHFIVQILAVLILGIGALALRDLGKAVINYSKTLRK